LNNHDVIAPTITPPEVTMDDHGSAVVACTLGSGDLTRRAARWEALAARSLVRAARTERGLRLVLRTDPGVAGELRDLVTLERDCCAFAAWSVHENGTELTLDVTGDSDQALAGVQSLFPNLNLSGGGPQRHSG
jgi:hypothetical protein